MESEERSMDIRRKIKGLLRLGQSPNTAEAKAALAKAQEMILKYGIEDQGEIIEYKTAVSYSAQRNPWTENLAYKISTSYRCEAFLEKTKNHRIQHVCFVGYDIDIEICRRAFNYTYELIINWIEDQRLINKKRDPEDRLSTSEFHILCNSFAMSFIKGLFSNTIDPATGENAIVCLTPKEVTKTIEMYPLSTIGILKYHYLENVNKDGEEMGANFTLERKLE